MKRPRDMTAFCKVTVVTAAPAPQLPQPAPKDKPPAARARAPKAPAGRAPPARAPAGKARAKPRAPPAPAAEQPHPAPYEPEGLEFSRLDGEDAEEGDSGPEWEDEEEVHEDLGDQGSHDYPSEDDLPLPEEPRAPAAPPPRAPPPAPVQYAGRCLELEEEVF